MSEEEINERIEELQKQLRATAQRRALAKEEGNEQGEAEEESRYNYIVEQISDLNKQKENSNLSLDEIDEKLVNLEKVIKASSERLAEYKRVGNEQGEAEEMSYRQKILNKISKFNKQKEEVNKKIEELNQKYKASSERLAEYKRVGNEQGEAEEMSHRQKLLSEISKLKNKEKIKEIENEMAKKSPKKVKVVKKQKGKQPDVEQESKETEKQSPKKIKIGAVVKEDKQSSEISDWQKSELERYGDLVAAGYDQNSKEMQEFFKQIALERKNRAQREAGILETDENGNLKYPPAQSTKNKYELANIEDKSKTTDIIVDNIVEPGTIDIDGDKGKATESLAKEAIDKELSIVYSGKENTYTVKNWEDIVKNSDLSPEKLKQHIDEMNKKLSQPIKAYNFKNKKEKLEFLNGEYSEEDMKYIFGDKKIKTCIKNCDVQLLAILSDIDIDLAKNYIDGLTRKKDEEKTDLGYKMEYNLKGMRKEHEKNKLSFLDRFRINRMAKKNKNQEVAEYVPDDRSLKWLAIPAAGVLALGTAVGLTSDNKDKVQQTKETQYTDLDTSETTKDADLDVLEQTTSSVDMADEEQENQNLVLGSQVSIPAGVTYTADSLGNGAKGVIEEVAWRPAGDYTLDRVALYYNGKLQANLGVEGTDIEEKIDELADKLGVDSSEINTEAHICLGENHVGATGWIQSDDFSMDDIKANISKTYDEIQQEKAQNEQTTQENTKEQSSSER